MHEEPMHIQCREQGKEKDLALIGQEGKDPVSGLEEEKESRAEP